MDLLLSTLKSMNISESLNLKGTLRDIPLKRGRETGAKKKSSLVFGCINVFHRQMVYLKNSGSNKSILSDSS